MENILLTNFNTPLQAAPFDKIRNENFLPAFKVLIAAAEEEIHAIADNPVATTFENTIEALAYAGKQLDVVSNLFFNLNSAETNDELQAIASDVAPMLTAHSSRITQNKNLFKRIQEVYAAKASLTLNEEQQMLLRETYKGFVRSGALLSDADKLKLEKINSVLSVKSLQFGQNVLAATNAYHKHVEDKEELRGIPESVIAQYQEEAKAKGKEGYLITLQYPSYLPALTYAEDRNLRKELALASGKKAFDGGQYDNRNLIAEIVQLRRDKALLLGYKNFATYVLEERMAKSPEKVLSFLQELLQKATPYAQKEIVQLKALAEADKLEEMQTWDHAFYAEKLRKQKFDLNDEELKPFFSLKSVQEAVFGLAEKLFGFTFEKTEDVPVYHTDVQTYKVYEKGDYKALLYVDYHPRCGKRPGAWMTNFTNQYKKDGENHRPHVSVVCNFTMPIAGTPSLLSFQEVTTLFHEFGHALHGILANTQYPSLSGTSVKWDFVELPSQFLENYCYEPLFLKTFAQHYKTGEVLSDEKIEKLAASKNFMEGYQTLRQLGFGLLDMAYHTSDEEIVDVKSFETDKTKATNLYASNPETAMSTSFSHIFQGGYAAGYYSYKWAEVLDADAFQCFKENGIFDEGVAERYKHMLAQGGTQDPMQLYKEFRGAEPQVDSLLLRAFGKSG